MRMAVGAFGVLDYIIFALTLGFPVAIGIYFGCFGSRQKSASDYLYGAGKQKVLPVGLSIYSSSVSAIAILGIPSEIYVFGTQFLMVNVGIIIAYLSTWVLILPIFCTNKNIKTPYEYVELRYNYKVRILSSLICILQAVLNVIIILHASTLSFSETTNISLPLCTTVIGGLCVFYTALGGFTTVIWSDTLQATLMSVSCIFILIKGVMDIGSFSEVWNRAERGQRIQFFNMDPNPFERVTFWSSITGMAVSHFAHSGGAAGSIQRYMSLRDEKQARISGIISVCGILILNTVCGLIGLCMYALYYECDPIKNKDITGSNKLVSHYVANVVKGIPGFSGFFNAGLLSAGLSTMSSELNTVSGLVYYDIVQKISRKEISEKKGTLIMKTIVLVNGIFCLAVAPLLQMSDFIFPLVLTIGGVTYGVKIGLFVLATTFPKSNATGVICGTVTGLVIVGWIAIGGLMHDTTSSFVLPASTEGCVAFGNYTELLNITTTKAPIVSKQPNGFSIFQLSYMYYSVLGLIITLVIGMIVSYITGPTDIRTIDPKLLMPYVRLKQQNNFDEGQNMINNELKNITP